MKKAERNENTPITADVLKSRTAFHLKYSRGRDDMTATDYDKFWSFALCVRDLVIERMIATHHEYYKQDAKRLYYLSMEFLIGRMLHHNLLALNLLKEAAEASGVMDIGPENLFAQDPEAGLGNGGLGRLAACYLDSLASQELPGYGYGLRYEHGIFRQEFEDGWQRERPDSWLELGYPWEMVQPEYSQPVYVYGRLQDISDPSGKKRSIWTDWQMFKGIPYDLPVIGYGVNTVNILRLWSAHASEGFRLDVFNKGDYVKAVEEKNWAETVTKVLYPSDETHQGKELRLIQEYFLVTCSLRDIIRRYRRNHKDWDSFADKTAIQMNDTHPALSIAELMNLLCYEHDLPWDKAWDITVRSHGYTNHTLLPEALEKWSESLLSRVLPRHMNIIYEINHRFLQKIEIHHHGDPDMIRRVSIFEEGPEKYVRMANLAIIGSHKVNGVSALHSQLVRDKLVPDFAAMEPDKFINVTNGVTHRRWLLQCNPNLAKLITDRIGYDWIHDLEKLRELEPLAEDPEFRKQFMTVKRNNKKRLARIIENNTGYPVCYDSLFDIQVKRLHMYKRQMLNAMHIIDLYLQIKENPHLKIVPRTFIFGAKAAPAYHVAKRVIKLINTLAEVINNDSDVAGQLKIIFLPDYNVSHAEKIIPAADLSEQISTAGMEASGTGNMKLSLNGALTIGTWDGATIEIAQHVGEENIFIFGKREHELEQLRRDSYNPWEYYDNNPRIRTILDTLRDNPFRGEHDLFRVLFDDLTSHGDHFFYLADYEDYARAQRQVDELYRNPDEWARKAILNVARMGWFSSDRSIREYSEKVWGIEPIKIPPADFIPVSPV